MHLYQPLCPSSKACKEWFHCEVCDYNFHKETRSTQNNLCERRHHMQEYHWNRFLQPQKTIYVKNDNWLLFFDLNGLPDVEESASTFLIFFLVTPPLVWTLTILIQDISVYWPLLDFLHFLGHFFGLLL